ncbi:ATP-binding protein [Streptomyces sp. NPDC051133]|uniref:ATP-binding protein n=1 Tax=Streptomyces sp. NPDC051133 TaxID=3155521 RepID=UPI00342624FD
MNLPGNSRAITQARTIARYGLTVIGWEGDVHAATEVLSQLVKNAVQHGVAPDNSAGEIGVSLAINEIEQLIIDVTDPSPFFPGFASALRGAQGRGLRIIQRRQAEITWFAPPSLACKTVRATMTAGTVDR